MVSIIVPVYKVEKYLARCVNSLMRQTYKDIEIILVDDGSPDSSGKICDDFSKRDIRIKVIHKLNGGLSSARNAGLQIARGEYLCFVDSDDWVDDQYIEILLNALIDYDADISACNWLKGAEMHIEKTIRANTIELVTDMKFFYALTENHYAGYACNKLFKSSIVKNHQLLFDEQIFNGEDLPFIVEYLQYCERVAYTKDILYFYFIRPNSITTTFAFSDKKFSIIYAREKVLGIIENAAPACTDIVIYGYISHLIKMKYLLYPVTVRIEHKDKYNEINRKLKTYKNRIFKLKNVTFKNKVKLYLMTHFQWLFGMLYRKTKVI